MTLTISKKGLAFTAAHEGFVSRAYLCPAGVRTIGYGFTMGSRIFADYWRTKHGRGLQNGDTITREEADMLLEKLFAAEYGAAVNRKIGTKVQHQFDGAASVSFNCGPGSLDWKWAKALAAGKVAEAARLLRTTAVTANGRRLAGLVRRRDEEAMLIETGRYAVAHGVPVSASNAAVREYQQWLKTLGYDVGAIDGKAGPKTKAAVLAFQRDHKLVVDGIVGPATRAAMIRALDTARGAQATGGGGLAGGAGGAGTTETFDPSQMDFVLNALLWGAAIAAVIALIFVAVKYRGVFTGKRVPT